MKPSTNKSFFLLEDEALIRMMLAEMVEHLGHRLAAEAGSLGEALPIARGSPFDIAILDINLGGGSNSAPVAEIIASRGIPFFYASGYVKGGMPESFNDRPLLRKPFLMDELAKAIEAALTKA